MADIQMKYGGYSFIPVPPLNITKNIQQSEDATINGVTFTVELNGTLASVPTGGLALVIQKQNELRNGVKEHGQLFTLTCDGSVLISGYPRLIQAPSFSPSNNNWVFSSPYTIVFEFDDFLVYSGDTAHVAPPYLTDTSESWSLEFVEDSSYYVLSLPTGGTDVNPYKLRLTHTLGAVGKAHYDANGLVKPAWKQARDSVVSRLGYNSEFIGVSGVFNLDATQYGVFNHVRTNETDVRGGSFTVTETWLVLNTGVGGFVGRATEDFTANVNNSIENGGVTSITIEGTIQGLESRDYGTGIGDFTITESKYSAASGYWANIQSKLLGRAILLGSGVADRNINPQPLSKSVGHSPSNGTITYAYEYDDRPSNCINGSLRESFVVNDTNPNDVFASITVLGRSKGPVLQSMGTSGQTTREVIIEVLMPATTGCPTTPEAVSGIMSSSPKAQVDLVISAFKQELINRPNSQVFVNNDVESWDWRSGRYSRNVSWTYQNACS